MTNSHIKGLNEYKVVVKKDDSIDAIRYVEYAKNNEEFIPFVKHIFKQPLKPLKPSPIFDYPEVPEFVLPDLDIEKEQEFVVKDKKGRYFNVNKEKTTNKNDARLFQTVLEALNFADCIDEETEVDAI